MSCRNLSAELIDVPWDKALQAILDMKNYASDVDVASNLIRIHAPETLTAQENYKSQRAQAVKKKVELEDSVDQYFQKYLDCTISLLSKQKKP